MPNCSPLVEELPTAPKDTCTAELKGDIDKGMTVSLQDDAP